MRSRKGIIHYLNDRIWNVRLRDRNPVSAFFFKQLRIIIIVIRNFVRDKLQLQAAGLTYYTLLSVVPVVALVFAIAKGFGFQAALEKELRTMLKGHEEVIDFVLEFAVRMLDNTKSGLLAGVGVVVLLWSVMQLLANIEMSFNNIFQVTKGRSWIRKFTEYFSIMLVAPVVIILSSSTTVLITTQIEQLSQNGGVLHTAGPAIEMMIRFIPYGLIWLLFTFVYMVMPNTKVNLKSAFIAGIIAGTSFQLLQWGYIEFQVGVSKYNAIYGSFAALPLFLIWVNMSWLITLIGAEVAYANQFVTEIENEVDSKRLSNGQQHMIAIAMVKLISEHFRRGKAPLDAKAISNVLGLPFGVTSRVLEQLVVSGLVTDVEHQDDDPVTFLPARNLEDLTIHEVRLAIDNNRFTPLAAMEDGVLKPFADNYGRLQEQVQDLSQNARIRDLPAIEA